jgi:2-hydroxychromene-2-carboxylate isomerase
VFEAEFARGLDIASEAVLVAILSGLGLDAAALLARSVEPEIKERLRAATAEAEADGIFGAPTFVASDGELFWGDDRLEAALAAAISAT